MHQTLHRIEVRTKPGVPDARAKAIQRRAQTLGYPVNAVTTAKVYFVEAALSPEALGSVQARLLADPVTEEASLGAAPAGAGQIIEVHPLPGVMDPVAQSVAEAIKDLTGTHAHVSTGSRFDLPGLSKDQADQLARQMLANPVIHQISAGPWTPSELPKGHGYHLHLRTVPLLSLNDDQLTRLSRDAHLFLSLEEMQAIQQEFQRVGRDPTDIELETLAQTWSEHCVHKTLKSTVRYATSADENEKPDPIDWTNRPNHTVNDDGSVTIDNLLKSTVAAATFELIDDGIDWTLSVFKDNSGIVALDDNFGVCIKVETHNHPSALEPYGGAATGAGGCIRDVMGTGLGAKPIANTDVFCVAFPGHWRESKENAEVAEKAEGAERNQIDWSSSSNPSSSSPRTSASSAFSSLPPGTLHPRRILTDIVSGVRDYGNRMGIPTLNGAVAFDDRYVGNPLVFCGCIGLIPRHLTHGQARKGDRIIALGGRTGRDGIHGATFSSAELEQGHSDEFSHAVQIGNAIEEKRVLDAIMRARDISSGPLYTAMTDCGAGGFSSAVGEMGKDLGAAVHLDRAPLKYAGLSYTEIWISEAQERMVLAVPPENIAALQKICDEEHVELADLGEFGTDNADLILFYKDTQVGQLSMHFLHEGIPTPTREAVWVASETAKQRNSETGKSSSGPVSLSRSIAVSLASLLSHPTIASKHFIIRQYDHEVQGNTILKPLVGPGGRGPGDAAVLEPVSGSGRAIAIGCGLQTPLGDPQVPGSDPYHMALAAIDECIRNVVCVGGDPAQTAILDNFCWPSCGKPENMGSLVRAAEGCYDAAKAYRTPFVSGKDSLNNQLRYTDPATGRETVIEIPPTLLITGLALVRSLSRVTTMDAKKPGNLLIQIGETTPHMAGSLVAQASRLSDGVYSTIPTVDLKLGPATARAVAQSIADGLVASAHDCSEGGMLVAVAEMLIATTGATTGGSAPADAASPLAQLLSKGNSIPPLGAELSITDDLLEPSQLAFAESPSRYILEIKPDNLQKLRTIMRDFGGIRLTVLGKVTDSPRLVWQHGELDVPVQDLADAWRRPLDW